MLSDLWTITIFISMKYYLEVIYFIQKCQETGLYYSRQIQLELHWFIVKWSKSSILERQSQYLDLPSFWYLVQSFKSCKYLNKLVLKKTNNIHLFNQNVKKRLIWSYVGLSSVTDVDCVNGNLIISERYERDNGQNWIHHHSRWDGHEIEN